MTNISFWLEKLRKMEAEGKSILEMMDTVQLDPKAGFLGGDWRYVDFNNLDLRGKDFRQCRLFGATFAQASVGGADFRGSEGATPIKPPYMGLVAAKDWSDGVYDDHQRLALTYRSYLASPHSGALPVEKFIDEELITENNYLDFMRNSNDYDMAREIYERMKKMQGVLPNKFALTELLLLSRKNDTRITKIYAESETFDVSIDEIFLNTMTSCFDSLERSEDVSKLFLKHGLMADEFYFNIMINKAPTQQKAESYLRQMHDAGIPPSNITINSLMTKRSAWTDRMALINSMTKMKLEVRTADINNLLMAAESKVEIRDTLDLFRKLGVPKDNATHNIRIRKRNGVREAFAVVREIIDEGKKPDLFTQGELMNLTTNIAEVCQVMIQLRPFDIDIFNEKTISRMIRLSPNPEWSATRSQGLEMSGAPPSERARALITHWIDPKIRPEMLRQIFGKIE